MNIMKCNVLHILHILHFVSTFPLRLHPGGSGLEIWLEAEGGTRPREK